MRKTYIVKSHQDFDNIIKNGSLQKNKSFIVYYLKTSNPYAKFGISVGKKLGNAVFRNKYKRKIRAIIDNCSETYLNGLDYIIILRGIKYSKTYQELFSDLANILTKIRKEALYDQKQ